MSVSTERRGEARGRSCKVQTHSTNRARRRRRRCAQWRAHRNTHKRGRTRVRTYICVCVGQAFDADTLPPPNATCSSLKMEEKVVKKKKRGIIYLSTIPRYMNVTKIREIFSAYGQVGRVYLQLADNEHDEDKNKGKKKKMRKMPAKHFTEGWIEFESKKVAKFVAETLNNKQVSTRKKSRFYDVIWNIKYLPRFKWTHLSERLAYERAVHKQRLRAEIAQAKRETSFLSANMDRSKKLKARFEKGESSDFIIPEIKQRETDMEIRQKKNEPQNEDRTEFLKSLFG